MYVFIFINQYLDVCVVCVCVFLLRTAPYLLFTPLLYLLGGISCELQVTPSNDANYSRLVKLRPH